MTTYDGNPASYPVHITIPDDGVPDTAADVNVAIEALADRTANLNSRTDTLEFNLPIETAARTSADATLTANVATLTTGLADITGARFLQNALANNGTALGFTHGSGTTTATVALPNIPGLHVGDLVEVAFHGSVDCSMNTTSSHEYHLEVDQGSGYATVPGTSTPVQGTQGAGVATFVRDFQRLSLTASYVVTTLGTHHLRMSFTSSLNVSDYVVSTDPPPALGSPTPWNAVVKVYRTP